MILISTIKKIAELTGVSRGTVDRVLNHRGNVKFETAVKVLEMAKATGYTPNRAARALAARKKGIRLGALICSEGNHFFDDLLGALKSEAEHCSDYSLKMTLKTMKGYDVSTQLVLLDELQKDNIHALMLTPINDPAIARRIDELCESGIAVIAVNVDIENSRRLCYVGSDYIQSGRTACGMMGLITQGHARVGIVTGSIRLLGHNQRIAGFSQLCKQRYTDIMVVDIVESNDDDIQAYAVTKQMLADHPDINALYITAGGVYGACRAAQESGRSLTIISFDDIPSTREMLRAGVISATICQQPDVQGALPVELLVRLLVEGKKPDKDFYCTKIEIKTREMFESV